MLAGILNNLVIIIFFSKKLKGDLTESSIKIGDIGHVEKGSWIGDEILVYEVWAKIVDIDEDNVIWFCDRDGNEYELVDPTMFVKEVIK